MYNVHLYRYRKLNFHILGAKKFLNIFYVSCEMYAVFLLHFDKIEPFLLQSIMKYNKVCVYIEFTALKISVHGCLLSSYLFHMIKIETLLIV